MNVISSIHVDCASTLLNVHAGREVPLHVVVQVGAAPVPAPRREVVLLLDLSASMRGPAIQHLVATAGRLLGLLGEQDEVGLVPFASRPLFLAPLCTIEPVVRKQVRSWLRSLTTRSHGGAGRADLGAALRHASNLFGPPRQGVLQRVVVLSGGQLDAPTPEHDARTALFLTAHQLHARGLTVSTLRCGPVPDDALLAAVAEGGGGRHASVWPPAPGDRALREALGGPVTSALTGACLRLTPGEDVSLGRVLGGLPARVGPDGIEVALPDLLASGDATIVVEGWMRAWRQGPARLVQALVTGTDAGGAQVHEQAEAWAEVCDQEPERRRHDALEAATLALTDERVDRAREAAGRGKLALARALLRRAIDGLREAPGVTPGDGSALDTRREALRLERALYRDRMIGPTAGRALARGKHLTPSAQLARSERESTPRRRRTAATTHASLLFLDGPRRGERVSLDRLRMVLGRDEHASIALPGLEHGHAIIEQFAGDVWIFDLGPAPGLRVNGRAVRCHHLNDGDRVSLHGHGPLLFQQSLDDSAPHTRRVP